MDEGVMRTLSRVALAAMLGVVAIGSVQAAPWAQTYGEAGPGFASSVQQTPDGGYVATGFASCSAINNRTVSKSSG